MVPLCFRRASRPALLPAGPSVALGWALALLLLAARASSADCTPDSGISPCLDSDPLWLLADTGRFISIPAAAISPTRPLRAGAAVGYVSRPIILVAPAPDPQNREIKAIDHAYHLAWLLSHAVHDRVIVSAALPATVRQSGTGPEAVTSQQGKPLPATALRDPRVAVGVELWHRKRGRLRGFAAQSRLQLALPLGQEDRLAGGRSATVAPTLLLELSRDGFCVASELGARLRQPSEFAGARLGSQAVVSLGVGVNLLPNNWLSFAVEAWMLPALISQSYAGQPGAIAEEVSLVPAEWLLSLRSAPLSNGEFILQLGAGTGIPLSSEHRRGGQTEHFAAVTTPAWRGVAVAKYVPRL